LLEVAGCWSRHEIFGRTTSEIFPKVLKVELELFGFLGKFGMGPSASALRKSRDVKSIPDVSFMSQVLRPRYRTGVWPVRNVALWQQVLQPNCHTT
jgi:hypothetical protein